ncbi:hypothetical protein ABZ027_02915 [Streptomyces sp. NPDC006332]|uniref:hypothetical protein n=1 Tax=Streptomyces sp. NPDC006332 TaxID=3155456 RepID=UPI0033B789AF
MSSGAEWSGVRGKSLALLWGVLGVLLGSQVVCVDAGHGERTQQQAKPLVQAQAQAEVRQLVSEGWGSAVAIGTQVSAAQVAHRVVAAEHPHHCPAGTPCCVRSQHAALHPVRTTLPGTVQALSALLPRLPRLAAPDGRPSPRPPSSRGAPDLHVLQVQRT